LRKYSRNKGEHREKIAFFQKKFYYCFKAEFNGDFESENRIKKFQIFWKILKIL